MRILIKNGQIVDPGNPSIPDQGYAGDLLIENGKIAGINASSSTDDPVFSLHETDKIIDASGKFVVPGLIDIHVHLREPGHEYKETIASGSAAAACGGFTTICCMPNTNPVNDNRQVTEFIKKQAEAAGLVRVYPIAAISPGNKGKGLTEFGDLKKAGAVALSDDGSPVSDSQLMRKAMEYAKGFDLLIISHCEDLQLVSGGVMNEGPVATRMGLAGIPNAAESTMVMRDIAICELTGAKLHIAHVSTKESVEFIRNAKKRGIKVSAETAPHYFTLTDEAVSTYDTNAKMNPPLRSIEDRQAIREALSDGTIDVIATDHAPHSLLEKELEFDQAANGIIGLETSVSLGLRLVEEGVLSFRNLVEKMSKNPARILGLQTGLSMGDVADITIIDPGIRHIIDIANFRSLSKNSPFNGWEMKGKAVLTMVGGKIVFDETFSRS